LLLQLTLIITRREPTAYEAFLHGLAAYGLAPQDESEERALADALERLGLLVRYSDSGEASFVAFGN
jgi:DNA phosphorothioation-dependent restriction protein DptG